MYISYRYFLSVLGNISWWSWFAFLWWLMMFSIFWCACWESACLVWKNAYLGLLPISNQVFNFFLILSCMCYLYVLDIKDLSVNICKYFSHSIGCLCDLVLISFGMKILLSLIRFHLFIFAFVLVLPSVQFSHSIVADSL